jgi:hypothetical protein
VRTTTLIGLLVLLIALPGALSADVRDQSQVKKGGELLEEELANAQRFEECMATYDSVRVAGDLDSLAVVSAEIQTLMQEECERSMEIAGAAKKEAGQSRREGRRSRRSRRDADDDEAQEVLRNVDDARDRRDDKGDLESAAERAQRMSAIMEEWLGLQEAVRSGDEEASAASGQLLGEFAGFLTAQAEATEAEIKEDKKEASEDRRHRRQDRRDDD